MQEDTANDNCDEPEFIDQSVWVPQGQEIVPAALFLNRHALAIGKRFMSAEATLVDRLLVAGRIDDSHHALALRIINLFRMGTAKQGYAVMKIFMPTPGHDNSDFCPMSLFIKITRTLRNSELRWIRVICGIESCHFEDISRNANLVKDALEKVENNLSEQDEKDDPNANTVVNTHSSSSSI